MRALPSYAVVALDWFPSAFFTLFHARARRQQMPWGRGWSEVAWTEGAWALSSVFILSQNGGQGAETNDKMFEDKDFCTREGYLTGQT